jgi:hypothetical protein
VYPNGRGTRLKIVSVRVQIPGPLLMSEKCDGVIRSGDRKEECSRKAVSIVRRGSFEYKACKIHRTIGRFVRDVK